MFLRSRAQACRGRPRRPFSGQGQGRGIPVGPSWSPRGAAGRPPHRRVSPAGLSSGHLRAPARPPGHGSGRLPAPAPPRRRPPGQRNFPLDPARSLGARGREATEGRPARVPARARAGKVGSRRARGGGRGGGDPARRGPAWHSPRRLDPTCAVALPSSGARAEIRARGRLPSPVICSAARGAPAS